jgi:thiosulfate dehydrogenase [quinone] large subunit
MASKASSAIESATKVGAMAMITLPVTSNVDTGSLHNAATLQLRTVNGNAFDVAVRAE